MIRLDNTSEQSIITMLRDNNVLQPDQVKQIETLSKESGKSQLETAFELNITNDTKIAKLLSESFSIPLANLEQIKISKEVKKLAELRYLKDNTIIPFAVDGGKIKVAIPDASKLSLLKNIQSLTKLEPELHAASLKEIGQFIVRLDKGDKVGVQKTEKIQQVKKKESAVPLEVESDVIAFVDKILNEAIKLETSDIHIEPFKDTAHVRFRVDGVLRIMDQFTDFLNKDPLNYNSVVTRVKILSKLDIAERRVPQDGGATFKYGDKEMDLRISIMPTKNNERIVMRLLNKEAGDKSLDKLGFADEDLKLLTDAINSPQGMVLVTGPTGSGKTTTLYSILKTINKPSMNILTAEDPVEYELEGVGQVQVRDDIGYTFEKALRSFLRQDPEIILVGEMRDKETVDIGLKAALTGHLVFSTLHTNDAPSTITRLQNMGTPDYLISAACQLVLAQRLARRTCKDCRVPDDDVNPKVLQDLGFTPEQASRVKAVKGKGCPKCKDTGYKGRQGLYEILVVSKPVKEAILRKATTPELREIAVKEGFQTMQDMGRRLIANGELNFREYERVLSAS